MTETHQQGECGEVDDDDTMISMISRHKLRLHGVAANLNEGNKQRGEEGANRVGRGEQRNGNSVEAH
jgi:hypothetical protein